MREGIFALVAVAFGWGLNCVSQMFSYDAVAGQSCLAHLQELDEHLQVLAKRLGMPARSPVDDNRGLRAIEKCVNKLRVASAGLRIQNKEITSALASSSKCFSVYRIQTRETGSETHGLIVELCEIWGFGMHPYAPSERLVRLQEFMQQPIRQRLWTRFKGVLCC